jgi:hypothetical protein
MLDLTKKEPSQAKLLLACSFLLVARTFYWVTPKDVPCLVRQMKKSMQR